MARDRDTGWRSALRRSRSPLELPVELFRFYPRLRILVGFFLAFALGSIVPNWYAGSVVENKVAPLLLDLSTARAHGNLLSGTPGYRTPEQIQQAIDGVKTRHSFYTFVMWLGFSGVFGFLWFRFLRPD